MDFIAGPFSARASDEPPCHFTTESPIISERPRERKRNQVKARRHTTLSRLQFMLCWLHYCMLFACLIVCLFACSLANSLTRLPVRRQAKVKCLYLNGGGSDCSSV
uniref:Uncharacterized protein n=1 Tax=Glossina pallidipes TaxID=7398 RepID=A0A1B0AIC3_GLOPL